MLYFRGAFRACWWFLLIFARLLTMNPSSRVRFVGYYLDAMRCLREIVGCKWCELMLDGTGLPIVQNACYDTLETSKFLTSNNRVTPPSWCIWLSAEYCRRPCHVILKYGFKQHSVRIHFCVIWYPRNFTGIFRPLCQKSSRSHNTTCSSASSYLLLNSNKFSFVPVCSLLFSVAVPNNYTPVCNDSVQSPPITVSVLPSASSLQYPHLCHEVIRV